MSSRTRPEHSRPVSQDAVRMAPYSYRAPSPPCILVPIPQQHQPLWGGNEAGKQALELVPSLQHVDPTQVSGHDLAIITRGKTQRAKECGASWSYELRRQAQPCLDFLYLGPTSVIRDHEYLRREGITMVLVARDTRTAAAKLISVEHAVSALGIVGRYVDIDGSHGMIQAYPHAIRLINDHMLTVNHAQTLGSNDQDPSPADRHGKVLVACESGNERAAGIVSAYIMAMYGESLVPAVQFTNMQRFCCYFDENVKRSLQAWDDILLARRVVALGLKDPNFEQQQRGRPGDMDLGMEGENWQPCAAAGLSLGARTKRGVDDMLDPMGDGQDSATDAQGNPMSDMDRFVDRDAFAPFMDVDSR